MPLSRRPLQGCISLKLIVILEFLHVARYTGPAQDTLLQDPRVTFV